MLESVPSIFFDSSAEAQILIISVPIFPALLNFLRRDSYIFLPINQISMYIQTVALYSNHLAFKLLLNTPGATPSKYHCGWYSLAFTKAQTISSSHRDAHHCLRQTLAEHLVVEPSPIRSLAADCPINAIFRPSHLAVFQTYVVVSIALRGFQQFNGLFFKRIAA